MIVLVSGATRNPRDARVGHLIVPRQWNTTLDLQPQRWAMDNGAFSGFDEGAFVRMLERFADRPGCLFVSAPDVIADAAATLTRWPFWSRLIRGLGLPVAFVAQDGLTRDRIPWGDFAAIFIGGTTEYKESGEAREVCAYAKAHGVWVHWGRVNGKRRYELARKAGADSIDGTGFSIYPAKIGMAFEWEEIISAQPELDL